METITYILISLFVLIIAFMIIFIFFRHKKNKTIKQDTNNTEKSNTITGGGVNIPLTLQGWELLIKGLKELKELPSYNVFQTLFVKYISFRGIDTKLITAYNNIYLGSKFINNKYNTNVTNVLPIFEIIYGQTFIDDDNTTDVDDLLQRATNAARAAIAYLDQANQANIPPLTEDQTRHLNGIRAALNETQGTIDEVIEKLGTVPNAPALQEALQEALQTVAQETAAQKTPEAEQAATTLQEALQAATALNEILQTALQTALQAAPAYALTQIQAALQAAQPTEEIQAALQAAQPTEEIQRVLQAALELLRILIECYPDEILQLTEEIRQALQASLQALQVSLQAAQAAQPTEEIQRVLQAALELLRILIEYHPSEAFGLDGVPHAVLQAALQSIQAKPSEALELLKTLIECCPSEEFGLEILHAALQAALQSIQASLQAAQAALELLRILIEYYPTAILQFTEEIRQVSPASLQALQASLQAAQEAQEAQKAQEALDTMQAALELLRTLIEYCPNEIVELATLSNTLDTVQVALQRQLENQDYVNVASEGMQLIMTILEYYGDSMVSKICEILQAAFESVPDVTIPQPDATSSDVLRTLGIKVMTFAATKHNLSLLHDITRLLDEFIIKGLI